MSSLFVFISFHLDCFSQLLQIQRLTKYDHYQSQFFTDCNEVVAKVIFLLMSVILYMGGGGVCYPSMHCRWYPSMPCSRSPGGCLFLGCLLGGCLLSGFVCFWGVYLLWGCLLPGGCLFWGCGLLLWPSGMAFWFGGLLIEGGLLVWCLLIEGGVMHFILLSYFRI